MASHECSRNPRSSKRILVENVKPQLSRLTIANVNLFQRPLHRLTRHRSCELSDILEISSSSRDGTTQDQIGGLDNAQPGTTRPASLEIAEDAEEKQSGANAATSNWYQANHVRSSSTMSLPLDGVPPRRSSASIFGKATTLGGYSESESPSWTLPTGAAAGQEVPTRGRSDSPVRSALQKSAFSSDASRCVSSRTTIRTAPPVSILENGNSRHNRVEMSVSLPSPLFVGGATIEGHINLTVDAGARSKVILKPMHISRVSVDVIGVEEVSDGRRCIFLSLGTELFAVDHPPPMSLVSSQTSMPGSELCWPLKPASTTLPFCINLPLNVGPPPYISKQAKIRYFLLPSVWFKVDGMQNVIRQLCSIQMLTVHDPQKALASLPNPLVASDSLSLAAGPQPISVKLTAGLHRQTWVNGAMIFVDVHVVNQTPKTIKRLDIRLEKITVWYAHAAAGTGGRQASHLRLPRRTDTEVVSTSIIRRSKEWLGVPPKCSEVRTCSINVPQGLVTISTGRYFEVRYFLSVSINVTAFKTLSVQLPVTIIHINSLDILPNSLAQVAASIEAKRARKASTGDANMLYPPFRQGQAFAAPRRLSLDRVEQNVDRTTGDDISTLTRDLDHSPRQYRKTEEHGRGALHQTTPTHRTDIGPSLPQVPRHEHHHHHAVKHASCYHCHLTYHDHAKRPSSASFDQLRLPRLQLSTSALGFSDSDFELDPDSPPRKVMLSDTDRQRLRQERELKLLKQWTENARCKSNQRVSFAEDGHTINSIENRQWRNVAADHSTRYRPSDFVDGPRPIIGRGHSARGMRPTKTSVKRVRTRSRTDPGRLVPTLAVPRAGSHAMDRSSNVTSKYDVAAASQDNLVRPGRQRRHTRRSLENQR